MLTTLDLACPIAWKSTGQASSSTLANVDFASPKPAIKRELVGRQTREHTGAITISSTNDDDWLQRRYCESLWLGEDHSPLLGFLQHLGRFEGKLKRQPERSSQLMPSFARLLKSRQQIRRRYNAASSAIKGPNAAEEMIQCLCKDDDDGGDKSVEMSLIRMALESGPGSLVSAELRRISEKDGDPKLAKAWLRAIESRELQIQILLLLNLLRLSAEAPALPSPALSSATETSRIVPEEGKGELDQRRVPLASTQPDINGDSSAATPTLKRKRKADHAKRWTGGKGISAFPWTLQRQSSRNDSIIDSREEVNDTTPEALSKRFESLLDSLCLQVLTSNLSLDSGPAEKDQSPPTMKGGASDGEAAETRRHCQLFGSEGRRRQQSKGDKDVLQWLCCHIIEPHFSKTLPRQCGIVRGKCFVPGSGSTPAKPSRRDMDAPSLPRSVTKSAISIHRDQERQRDKEEERRRQRSICRVRSQSPALLQKPSLPDDGRPQQPLRSASSLVGKWDARTVSVRRKWDRSQSIGPTMKEAPGYERSSSLQPRGRTSITAAREVRSDQKDSQTLVMETPRKGQPYGPSIRSNSFSVQSQMQPRSTSSAAASLAAWRRTESQPVLSAGFKRQLSTTQCSEESGMDASISTFFEDSDEEGGFDRITAKTETASMPPRIPNLPHRSEDQPVLHSATHCSNNDGDSGDELKPITVTKKRRTMPGSLSFTAIEQQCLAAARNPFAVSQ